VPWIRLSLTARRIDFTMRGANLTAMESVNPSDAEREAKDAGHGPGGPALTNRKSSNVSPKSPVRLGPMLGWMY